MRIWDIETKNLCTKHLSGEHRELHGLWNILKYNKKGYSNHPETKRWVGKLDALKIRHDAIIAELKNRNKNSSHKTDIEWSGDNRIQDVFINTLDEQKENLKNNHVSVISEIHIED